MIPAYQKPVSVLSPGELFGGVETQVLGLCAQLQGLGIKTQALLFHDRELAARLRDGGIEPRVIRARHRYDPAAARRLADLVEENGSRVLHVHGYRAAVTAALVGSRLRAAVVKTEHGLPEPGIQARGQDQVTSESCLGHLGHPPSGRQRLLRDR